MTESCTICSVAAVTSVLNVNRCHGSVCVSGEVKYEQSTCSHGSCDTSSLCRALCPHISTGRRSNTFHPGSLILVDGLLSTRSGSSSSKVPFGSPGSESCSEVGPPRRILISGDTVYSIPAPSFGEQRDGSGTRLVLSPGVGPTLFVNDLIWKRDIRAAGVSTWLRDVMKQTDRWSVDRTSNSGRPQDAGGCGEVGGELRADESCGPAESQEART
ncbi:hypothetical protein F2P81_019617 [Scophthalmus maximus]|uniref:Uncharacterized protein n=1 Tax=Scophthalmus maximus TaxID=52904 RepID=A0A6A4SA53_SCOMX|nr:hypothetical protein F2P81_019617 [Scophthalmus maximus]